MRSFSTTTEKEKGFTIVEVLIALTLFSIAVAGVITAAVQGGINVASAQNRMTANYLAQEGIELMRAKRDSYVVSNSTGYDAGWADFAAATTTCSVATPCDIDVSDTTTTIPSSGAALGLQFVPCVSICPLKLDSSGYYSHSAAATTASRFTRKLTVTPFPTTSPSELQITSTVTWVEGSATQSITESESMFDWYGALAAP